MNLIFYKALAALLIFFAGMLTIVYPLKKKNLLKHTDSVELGEALASGIFLGAAFFHMLPDAVHTFSSVYPALTFPLSELICVLGFLLMLFLERLSMMNHRDHSHLSLPYILLLILTVHALTEGAALGVGMTLSETVMIFIAIIAHKVSESFALCIMMMRYQLPLKRTLWIIFFFSLMTPIGIALGTEINAFASTVSTQGEVIKATFNAFAAGTFLYMSTLHHVRFHHTHTEDTQGMMEFVCLGCGILAMALIALWA